MEGEKKKEERKALQFLEKHVSISLHTSDFLYLSVKERGRGFCLVVSAEHWGTAHTGGFQGQEQEEIERDDRESPRGRRQGSGGVISSSETFGKIFVLVKAYFISKTN